MRHSRTAEGIHLTGGGEDMTAEERRQKARAMEDYEFTASTGVRVIMDFSLLRSMSEEERRYNRARFDRVCREMTMKYAAQLAAAQGGNA